MLVSLVNALKDAVDGAWNDTLLDGVRERGTLHGVGFTTAGLTVREDRAVVTGVHSQQNRASQKRVQQTRHSGPIAQATGGERERERERAASTWSLPSEDVLDDGLAGILEHGLLRPVRAADLGRRKHFVKGELHGTLVRLEEDFGIMLDFHSEVAASVVLDFVLGPETAHDAHFGAAHGGSLGRVDGDDDGDGDGCAKVEVFRPTKSGCVCTLQPRARTQRSCNSTQAQ